MGTIAKKDFSVTVSVTLREENKHASIDHLFVPYTKRREIQTERQCIEKYHKKKKTVRNTLYMQQVE